MSVPKYGSRLDTPEPSQPSHGLLPSRGPPPVMKQIGYLTREHCEEVIGLYGQQKYPNSAQYEYYYEPSNKSAGRIPLCTTPGEQLWSGHGVALPGKKGLWKVTLFPPRVNYSY